MSKEISTVNVHDLRTQYNTLINSQTEIQSRFGSSFNLRDVNEDVQRTVIEGSRAVACLTDKGAMAKVKGVISKVPVLGRLVHDSYRFISDEALRNRRIDEITEGIFKSIRDKQVIVEDYCKSLTEIKNQSVQSYTEIVNIISDLKDVPADQLTVEENNFIIEVSEQEILLKDRIMKMEATIIAAERLSARITHMIPTLQNDLFNQLALNSTLDGIRSMNEQLNNTIEASYNIAAENDKAVKDALREVVKGVNNGDNYTRYTKRHEDFKKFNSELQEMVRNNLIAQEKMVKTIQADHFTAISMDAKDNLRLVGKKDDESVIDQKQGD